MKKIYISSLLLLACSHLIGQNKAEELTATIDQAAEKTTPETPVKNQTTTAPTAPRKKLTPEQIKKLAELQAKKKKPLFRGNMSFGLTYRKTTDPRSLARGLFGNLISDEFTENAFMVTGSQIKFRSGTDILADYFGLPRDFKSSISLNPIGQRVTFDINGYVKLDSLAKGLYFRTFTPLEWRQIDLQEKEVIHCGGIDNYPPGYFDTNEQGTPRIDLLNSAQEFFTGCRAPKLQNALFEKLRFSKLRFKPESTVRIARTRAELGWFFMRRPRLRVRLAGGISAPTGNRPSAVPLLEPISGNGGSWELDGRMSLFATIRKNAETGSSILFSLDSQIRHLFKRHGKKTYDLKTKAFSRYMLAQRISAPVVNNLKALGAVPTAQFKHIFAPLANITTFNVTVKIPYIITLSPVLTYYKGKNSINVGYTVSIVSPADIQLTNCQEGNCGRLLKEPKTWALKGDAHVFGFDDIAPGDPAVALSATQSRATISTGLNYLPTVPAFLSRRNPNIDTPLNATGDASGGAANNFLRSRPGGSQTRTTLKPIFLSMDDIIIDQSKKHFLSHLFFVSYTHNYTKVKGRPYISLGASILGNKDSTGTFPAFKLSQYGLWAFTGFTF